VCVYACASRGYCVLERASKIDVLPDVGKNIEINPAPASLYKNETTSYIVAHIAHRGALEKEEIITNKTDVLRLIPMNFMRSGTIPAPHFILF
jgi:hypothetical protein